MIEQRQKIIAGNWKMHGTKASVEQLLTTLKTQLNNNIKAEMIVFPPYIFLQQTAHLLQNTPIFWGGQNMAAERQGAFTGEISGVMLAEFDCRYVLLGHSERRALYGETDIIIAQKYKLALECGLQPILCIGETYQQRQAGQTVEVVTQQLISVVEYMGGVGALSDVILAYEPVWAIGTGLTASPQEAQEVHYGLRQQVALQNAELAQQMRILYGGSVKGSNAAALFAMPDIDGGLIGGASLDAREFFQIYQQIG